MNYKSPRTYFEKSNKTINETSSRSRRTILLQNNSPIDEFFVLSPTQIHELLYDTFGNNSPVQFRHDIDDKTLDAILLFRIVEDYLKIIQRDKEIKLTPLGALPKKVM